MTRPPTESDFKAPIYPAYCNHLSPTNSGKIWCPLFAADIHSLREESGYDGQNIYFHINHPIQFVYLTALIIDVSSPGKHVIITVDDSSGEAIDAVFPFPPSVNPITTLGEEEGQALPPEFAEFDLINLDKNIGRTVKIKGTLSMFRGRMQINLCRYSVLENTNLEVQFWDRIVQFKRKVWGKPWVLSEEQVRMCREERERQERREERRRRKASKVHTEGATSGSDSKTEPSRGVTKPAEPCKISSGPARGIEKTKPQSLPGDWICPSCGANNFASAKSTECFRCSKSRLSSEASDKPLKKHLGPVKQMKPGEESKFQVLPGDWTCPSCSENNFARLMECFKCFTSRPPKAKGHHREQSEAPVIDVWVREDRKFQVKPGDWTCPFCSQNNYARLNECFKCSTSRPTEAVRTQRQQSKVSITGLRVRDERKFQVLSGDWTCPSCDQNNYARLTECFKCYTTRPPSGAVNDKVKQIKS